MKSVGPYMSVQRPKFAFSFFSCVFNALKLITMMTAINFNIVIHPSTRIYWMSLANEL